MCLAVTCTKPNRIAQLQTVHVQTLKVALLFTSMLNQEPSTLWCVSLQQNPRPFFSTSKDMHVIVAAQTDSKQSDQTAAKRARCTRN